MKPTTYKVFGMNPDSKRFLVFMILLMMTPLPYFWWGTSHLKDAEKSCKNDEFFNAFCGFLMAFIVGIFNVQAITHIHGQFNPGNQVEYVR